MITIREPDATDTDAINRISESAIKTLRETYRPTRLAMKNKTRLQKELHRLVAEFDGTVAGTVRYYIIGNALHLIGLGVHIDYRKKGIGAALISELVRIGTGFNLDKIVLHTVKETGNVPFFENSGFEIIKESEDLYS